MPTRVKRSSVEYFDNVEQGTEEWLQLRENKFTGSNAAKLLTSFGAGSHAMAKIDTFKGNHYTERGHLLEGEALKLYEAITGTTVLHTGFVTNSKYPNCLYSPDGFHEDRSIEVKCFNPKKHLSILDKWENRNIIPVEILAQVYFGQLIMEKRLTDLILYCPKPQGHIGDWPVPVDKMLVIIPLKHDRDIINNFKEIIKAYNEQR